MKGMLGGILIAVGILVMGASGLCTVVFLSSFAGGSGTDQSTMAFLAVVSAMVGGLPFVGGIGMILAGRHVMRRAREDEDQAAQNSGTWRE